MVILEHSDDVQVFDIQGIELANQSVSDFVLEVQSGTRHILMGFGKQDPCLLTTSALLAEEFAFLACSGVLAASFQATLTHCQMLVRLLQKTRVRDRFMIVGEGGKV